jgi:hypothetical protein
MVHEMMSWLIAEAPANASTGSGGSDVVVTILSTLLGLAVVICLGLGTPRLLGQIVPVSRVEDARREGETKTAAAQAEAKTWKEAFDGMRTAHDGLLSIQRETQQSAVIANTVMSALRAQLPTAGHPGGF